MSAFTTTVAYVRPTLALPESARALRALRPSFRSIALPTRWVSAPEVSVHMAGPLRMPLLIEREVPVFVRSRRHVAGVRT